jgi:transcriptional regulator with XRE-family HTH domain
LVDLYNSKLQDDSNASTTLYGATVPAKPSNPIDVYVGQRIRMRRIEIDMSQQVLGGHIGLTFQQIQKYEKGSNRIGASRLQQIGKVLKAPVSFFFEGAPGGWKGETRVQAAPALLQLLGTREGQVLANAFVRITDAGMRRSFVRLMEKAATLIDNKPPKPGRSGRKPRRSGPRPKPKKK